MAWLRTTGPVFVLALQAIAPSPAEAQDVDAALKPIGAEAIRSVDSDLCLPADSEEYVALGKNAVLMLTARSAIAAELPLRSVYVSAKGLRIPLQRWARMEKTTRDDGSSAQVSFYLIPIYLTKMKAALEVDFAGDRKAFGVMSFAEGAGYYSKDTPAFVRLDEYDDPSEPDSQRLAGLLKREYPDYFGQE